MLRFNFELGAVSNDSHYTQFADNRVLAATARFGLVMTLVIKRLIMGLAGDESNQWCWELEEMFYETGDPLDEDGREVGSYDPSTNTFTWREPDFGARGYVAWFEKAVAVINFDEPSGQYYDPGFGASGELVNLVDPDGMTLRFFDSSNYVHHESDPSVAATHGFMPGLDPSILKDPVLNDGSVVPSDFRCGAMEGFLLRRAES
jgi:hypothetical protein